MFASNGETEACAARRQAKGDDGHQHLVRAGWNAGPGLLQRPGEAGTAEARDRAPEVKRPDNVTAGRHCQTPACVLARPKGRAKAIWWSKPLDSLSDPKPGGSGSSTATTPPCLTAARSTPGSLTWAWSE